MSILPARQYDVIAKLKDKKVFCITYDTIYTSKHMRDIRHNVYRAVNENNQSKTCGNIVSIRNHDYFFGFDLGTGENLDNVFDELKDKYPEIIDIRDDFSRPYESVHVIRHKIDRQYEGQYLGSLLLKANTNANEDSDSLEFKSKYLNKEQICYFIKREYNVIFVSFYTTNGTEITMTEIPRLMDKLATGYVKSNVAKYDTVYYAYVPYEVVDEEHHVNVHPVVAKSIDFNMKLQIPDFLRTKSDEQSSRKMGFLEIRLVNVGLNDFISRMNKASEYKLFEPRTANQSEIPPFPSYPKRPCVRVKLAHMTVNLELRIGLTETTISDKIIHIENQVDVTVMNIANAFFKADVIGDFDIRYSTMAPNDVKVTHIWAFRESPNRHYTEKTVIEGRIVKPGSF